MNVLVTGGAGFIGSHLVDALASEKFGVRVLDNFSSGFECNLAQHGRHIEVMRGDLSQPGIAERACDDIDAIFHFAAIPSVQRSIECPLATQCNGEVATLYLLDAAVKRRVRRLIFASSCSVYGDPNSIPVLEDAKLDPLSPYAAGKLACEGYLRAFAHCFNLDTVSLRYFNVYGPRQDPNSPYSGVISIFLNTMLAGRSVRTFGDGEQTRDFVFISDVVNANLLALRAPRRFDGAVVNIGSGQRHSLNRLIRILQGLLGTNSKPIRDSPRNGDIRNSEADLTKARQLLGYVPAYCLRDGLSKCISSFAESGDKALNK